MTKTEEQQKKDEFYMQRALDEARKAFDEDEIPVGAVVVCKDRIIARGHNLTETLTDVTAHAEMQVITAAALWDPMDCSTPGFPVLHYPLEFAQTHVH